MSDSQEQIESQLCAYVDDALDSKEQAEIERHLEANPQHRRLLDDLKAGRDLLRGLPREAAPAELADSFTGQLERSALLDGMGSPEPQRRMRIHKLPQIAAAAAIVLMASGLGAVVYFALPGGRPVVASSQSPPASHAVRPSAEPLLRDSAGDTDHMLKAMPSEKKLAEPAAAPEAEPLAKSAAPERGKESAGFKEADPMKLEAVARDVSNNRQVQELLFGKAANLDVAATQPAPREAVVMVVNSRDPNETRKQLAEYFTTNGIAWAPAPPADQAKLDKLANGTAGETSAGGGTANRDELTSQNNALPAKPAENSKTGSVASAEGQSAIEPGYAAPAQPVVPSAPSAAPAPVAQAAPAAQAPAPSRRPIDGQAPAQLGAAAAQNYVAQDQDASLGGLYVARNVSRRQAVELGKNLNRAGAEQAALFANAFESNHVAPVQGLAGGAPNDSKDARLRVVAQAAQGNLDRATGQSPERLGLAAKGAADAPSTPATQPQDLVAQSSIAAPADKAAQAEAGQVQRQARETPPPVAAESQERRDPQLLQSTSAPRVFAKRSEGAPEEATLPYSLAQNQAKQKAAAPTTAPANTEEVINQLPDEPATESPVDLVIVVQNGTKEVPVSIQAPAPAIPPAEQTAPGK